MRKGLHYIAIGCLHVCWRSAITGRWGIEVSWGYSMGPSIRAGF